MVSQGPALSEICNSIVGAGCATLLQLFDNNKMPGDHDLHLYYCATRNISNIYGLYKNYILDFLLSKLYYYSIKLYRSAYKIFVIYNKKWSKKGCSMSKRNEHRSIILAIGLFVIPFLLIAGMADAQTLVTSYNATSIAGNQAPPDYGLRLDGFFTGNVNDEVTFSFDNVLFNVYDDGTARLFGTVSVAEFNNSGGPGAYSSTWTLDVAFLSDTGINPSYDYYIIDPSAGVELRNQADPTNDYAEFVSYPNSDGAYFQVGVGANGKNSLFGASGWVNYAHTSPSGNYGSTSTHIVSSDFLMNLTVVPEPVSSTLFIVGGAVLGVRRYRKKRGTV
jgi:hypothetical protein